MGWGIGRGGVLIWLLKVFDLVTLRDGKSELDFEVA